MRELWWNNLCKFVSETLSVLIVILNIHYLIKKMYKSIDKWCIILKKSSSSRKYVVTCPSKTRCRKWKFFAHAPFMMTRDKKEL